MNKKSTLSFITFLLMVVSVSYFSCVKEVGPLPQAPIVVSQTLCDSLDVKWSADINSIMQAKCVMCHPGTGAPGNYNLHADVQTVALNGILWARVNDGNPSIMPQGGPKLPAADLQKINCWINGGALNN